MKKQTSLLSLLILGVWLMTTGQSLAQETESPKPSRWEVGVDLLTLIDKNNFPAYSLFGRYNLAPDAQKSTYLRLRIGYQYETLIDSTVMARLDINRSVHSPFLLAGIQRDLKTFNNSRFYLGADFYYQKSITKTEWGPDTEQGGMIQIGYENVRFKNVGSNILLGMSHQINTFLKVSLETSLSFQLENFRDVEEVWFYDEERRQISGRIGNHSGNKFTTTILPFSQLLLTYNF
jgi:hypothetical protein